MIVTTTKGPMDAALLEKREGTDEHYDDDGVLHDVSAWTEYWLDGELVHRSAHTTIKRVLPAMKPLLAKLIG